MWNRLDDELKACQMFIEQFWDDDGLDRSKIGSVHQRMTAIQEGQYLIDEQTKRLELDPASMVEVFMRALYGNEDFRAQIEGI